MYKFSGVEVDEKQGTRQRILTATVELLREGGSRRATVRAIASRAGVGIGLINYHFGSKQQLIHQAVGAIMGGTVASRFEPYSHPEVNPETRLRQLIRESGRVVARHPDLFKLAVGDELLEGDYPLANHIMPLLREIFEGEKRELELRLMAYSLIVSMQMALLRPEAFRRFSGIDLFEPDQRELALEVFVNNVLAQRQAMNKAG